MPTRAQILHAGFEVLKKAGPAGLTLRAVARRAQLTPMALYRHFKNKDDLVNAMTIEGLAGWEDRLRTVAPGPPAVRIASMFDAFLDYALRDPARFEAAFMLAAPGARRYPDDFADGASPAASLLVGEIKRAMRAKEMSAPRALEIGFTLWATAQGLISLYRAGRLGGGEQAFRRLYQRAMRRCLDSFRTEAQA